jgi:hypothetical protein
MISAILSFALAASVRLGGIDPADVGHWSNRVAKNFSSDYYRVVALDCDGAHVSVRITRDKRETVDYITDSTPIELIQFPLGFASGAQIGDSQAKVRERWGRPVKVAPFRKDYTAWMYRQALGTKAKGVVSRQIVVFHRDRVVELLATRDLSPGCGDDNVWSDGRFPQDYVRS